MTNSNLRIFIIILVVLVVAGVLLMLPRFDTQETSKEIAKETVKTETINTKPSIATEWQWQDAQKQTIEVPATTETGTSLPFTPESVFNALQAVKLDSDGNIILDHDALVSLDETLERIHDQLDSESLAILKQLIKDSLPGKAGEQTAQLVGDYYQYLGAKQEFSQISEAAVIANNDGSMQSAESIQALYGEMQSLREVHLGIETTASLFRVSDANAQYMFESMKLEKDASLTDEEREAKRQEIQTRHNEQSVNITNWPARYQAFISAKQNIINASIDDTEKQIQVNELIRQHFTTDELEQISHLGLERI